MKNKHFFRRFCRTALLFSAITVLGAAFSVSADVSFTTQKNPAADKIGVAGNPDFYPYEYYNEETGEYEGVFPELFDMLSLKCNLDFQYVDCSAVDTRLVDQKTGYAQIISAYIEDEKEMSNYLMTDAVPVITYENGGKEVNICLAFGKYADEDVIEKVTAAMATVTEDEIAALLAKYVNAKSEGEDIGIYILVIGGLVLGICGALGLLSVIVIRDNRKKKYLMQKELQDPLTGLGNKKYFEPEYNRHIVPQLKSSYVLAYIGFDITRVNKYYGEAKAEEQLRFAAQMLAAERNQADICARVSGGAFGILHVCSTVSEAKSWASKLVGEVNVFTLRFNEDYAPKFRAGVYQITDGKTEYARAMKLAQRCYQSAVDQGLDVVVSDEEMEKEDRLNERLSGELDAAMQTRQFQQFIQPIVRAKDGSIYGGEGLSRWQHPKLGLLYPGRYIALLIETNRITDLDMYLFEESCRRLEQWGREGKNYHISTNFTRVSISSADFPDKVLSIAERYRFDRDNLILEITEDSIERHREIALRNMRLLKDHGFRLALDDVGSGFSFFSDLKDYPLDLIKMDRDLLCSVTDAKGVNLMRGIINVCKSLGIRITCEGVETQEQFEMVRDMGCDYVQGYYFYKPLSPEILGQFFK